MVSSKLTIPSSENTVSVKILDGARVIVPAGMFMTPIHPDHPNLDAPCLCFLIEHAPTGKRVVFDLAVRMNPDETSVPSAKAMLQAMPPGAFTVEKDIATQLTEGGIPLETVSAVIWSHAHLDHTGDPATFPPTTDLVVGPGFTANLLPAYPTNPASGFFEDDIAGRKLTEISFENATQEIAGLQAHDYFGDGSFYLLNTPGHCHGHITGLARVTGGAKPTFILMGGDSCHHPGQLRPSHAHTIPDALLSRFQSLGIKKDTAPLSITEDGPVHHDPAEAKASLRKLQLLDGEDDVFVVLAHDSSLKGTLELFPTEANGWKKSGWKERTLWAYLEESSPAFRRYEVTA